jgi:DNA-binding GntR family transcriptional regulator
MNEHLEVISRGSDVPLYVQLMETLERRIQSGELRPGDMIPSESALIEEFKVSRITVRQALANMEQRGLVYRRRGRGTFVSAPHVSQKLNREARTIVEALRERGIEPEVRIVGMEQLSAPIRVAELLGLKDQTVVTRLRRVYLHENAPLALVDLYLPLAMSGVAEVLCREDHRKETTYSVFENEMHIKIKEARHIIHSTALEADAAEALNLPPDSTCLTMDRITYAENDRVLELMRFFYPSDSFEFEITLPRHEQQISHRVSENWKPV